MLYRIEVRDKKGVFDAVGQGVKKDILDLGINNIEDVNFTQIYVLEGDVTDKQVNFICKNLLTDPITQEYEFKTHAIRDTRYAIRNGSNYAHTIEVAHNPGVMDPVEETTLKGIRDLGITGIKSVHTAKKYILQGKLALNEINLISEKLLCNKVIQHIVKTKELTVRKTILPYEFKIIHIDLINAPANKLMRISKEGQLFLNLKEMIAIKNYFSKLGRNPTDCELESIAQTWSEHCKHKTLRGLIEYNGKTINNLLKNTVMKVTKELNKPWCVSVFVDNSGIIKFDEDHNVCFKVETHNHPSALEPYGGAGTGIGGVIRDPLGTGRGAKPILNTDVFCFGPPDISFKKIPKGTLHPKRIMKGVVSRYTHPVSIITHTAY
ncbi:MAG: phosphoribosylformylglycinamidine synthase subunit PurS, partial [Bacteroidales bacterium]|nr:phosphoribosylformylglycinamidine synthase subunit PurS [Bacteroidales bacterium]